MQPSSPRDVDVAEAMAVLRAGGIVAVPTETVYGLAADALNPAAVARVFRVKGRPEHHPLIVHLASADRLPGWAERIPDAAWRLADAFWPGPLTLVLARGPLASDQVTAGLSTVAVRVPDHALTLALLDGLGSGVAAPSANRFGRVSPTTAEHVRRDLDGDIDAILDGGPCRVGIESTIVDLSPDDPRDWAVLRPGGIDASAIGEVLGHPVPIAMGGPKKAPGQMASHYAPSSRLEVVPPADVPARRAYWGAAGKAVVVLGRAELGERADAWARALYGAIREADLRRPDVIVVETPPGGALADAVADRLRRASARG
ncbi:MAG: threonylcarbamoyl-AMP synthase [Deltaproteobacteria bacterium]|nr:threonylcarbamoyl-AMP synthase [Deltaproteobacteria bacterium]